MVTFLPIPRGNPESLRSLGILFSANLGESLPPNGGWRARINRKPPKIKYIREVFLVSFQ